MCICIYTQALNPLAMTELMWLSCSYVGVYTVLACPSYLCKSIECLHMDTQATRIYIHIQLLYMCTLPTTHVIRTIKPSHKTFYLFSMFSFTRCLDFRFFTIFKNSQYLLKISLRRFHLHKLRGIISSIQYRTELFQTHRIFIFTSLCYSWRLYGCVLHPGVQ